MRASVYFAVSVVLAVPCAISGHSPDVASQLDAAELKWKGALPLTYEFTFHYSAMVTYVGCESRTFHVRVSNDLPVELSDCDSLRESYGTVPRLFQFIRGVLSKHPDSLQVSFDPTLGYPTKFSVDYSEQVSDDHFAFSVTDLKVMK
jgi:hypothetical protein